MPEDLTHILSQFHYAAMLQNAIRVVIIAVIAALIWLVIRVVIKRIGTRIENQAARRGDDREAAQRRASTLTSLIRKVVAVVYWVAMVLTLLSQIGVNIGALVAGAGILGLAFSFGTQDLVKNYIAGFFMVLENQISTGDTATVNGTTGVVEEMNFRTTVIRSGDGAVHVFTNATITTLVNLTRDWSGYMYELAIAYDADVQRAIEVIKRVGAELRRDPEIGPGITADIEVFGVNKLADRAMLITGRIKTVAGAHWSVGRAFLARVKQAFDAAGIDPNPPPRQVTTIAPPLEVRQSEGAAGSR